MNSWIITATVLLLATVPCIVVLARGEVMERLVALQGAQVIVVTVLLVLALAYGRDIYVDVSVTLSVLNLASGLVFVRFLERWI